MKRLSLAVVRSQKEAILKELVQRGCVQVEEIDELVKDAGIEDIVSNESSKLMSWKSQYASLMNAVNLLNRYAPQKSALLSAKPELETEVFLDETGLQGSVGFAQAIEANDDRIKRIATEESRQRSIVESLKPWQDLGMKLNCEGTKYASVIIGTIPARISLKDVETALQTVTEECELFQISEDKSSHYVSVVCVRDALQAVQEVLRGYSFTASTLTGMEGTARECLREAEETLANLDLEKKSCVEAIKAEEVRRDDLKLAADKMSVKIAMAEAEEKLYGTESTVLLEGWMPAESEGELEEIFEDYDCAWETREPDESEYPQVPVKLKNNKLTNGLNMVTNMYSLPAYGTVDPNPLMAPFFIIFYGLMMADMAYGIIMIIAAIVAMKKIKPREGMLSFCQLLLWGGISTFIFGALTGGFFSDIPKQMYDLICASKGIEPVWQGLPKLFSPTEDSIVVLVGALVLGVIHLNTGLVISFVQKKKAGHLADGIWEEGTLWLLLAAIIVFALKKANIVPAIPDMFATIFLAVSVLLLLFGAGRNAKGFGKVTAAFGCIYNTATGWFGDILSYSRIMALMLAGGVVGQVFNTVAIMPAQSSGINVVTVIAFILIFLLGHAMNFGLNLLGCYVHDLRLQCLEFFGKFYQDGGKAFNPLRIKSKFINAKE